MKKIIYILIIYCLCRPRLYSQTVISLAPSGSPKIRLLPSALVVSSIMDQYNFYDPFIWHLNVDAKRSIEYNETAKTISFGLAGIEYKYKDRTQLYMLFSRITIDSVIIRTGYNTRRKLPSRYISQFSDDGILYQAFYVENVNWNDDMYFTAYLSSSFTNQFSLTLIAQDPSLVNKLLESAGEFLYGEAMTVLRLHGFSDTYATSFARYECSFSNSLTGISIITNAERIKLLILKPLISSIMMFRLKF